MKKNKIKTPLLKEYILARETVLKKLIECVGLTREEAKTEILAVINGRNSRKFELKWLNDFEQEIKK